jgi:hypothetical protein
MKYLLISCLFFWGCKKYPLYIEYQSQAYRISKQSDYFKDEWPLANHTFINLTLSKNGKYSLYMYTNGVSMGNYSIHDSSIVLYNSDMVDSLKFGVLSKYDSLFQNNFKTCPGKANHLDSFFAYFGVLSTNSKGPVVRPMKHPYSIIYANKRYENWSDLVFFPRYNSEAFDEKGTTIFKRQCGMDSIEVIDSFLKVHKVFTLNDSSDVFMLYYKQHEPWEQTTLFYDSIKFIILPNYGIKITEINGNKVNSIEYENSFLYRRAFEDMTKDAIKDTFYLKKFTRSIPTDYYQKTDLKLLPERPIKNRDWIKLPRIRKRPRSWFI